MAKNSRVLRNVAAAALIGLSLGGGVAPMTVAQTAASPVITQDTGSLTIHKYADPTATNNPTGEVQEVSGETLEGVGFTIYRVNGIDMSTNEGLAAAAGLKASDFSVAENGDVTYNGTIQGLTATPVGAERTTDANGEIVLSDLPIGAYLVVETSPLDGYSPAAPFVAFVPVTRGANEAGGVEWNYDVHAYPKNYKNAAEKSVDDANMQAGDNVTFTIDSDVPAVAEGATLSKYIVQDDLQENLISTTAAQVQVTGFTAGTDYNVTVDEATQQVEVTFTEAGLAKLTENKRNDASYRVETTIEAQVKAPTETGTLRNKAIVVSNNGSGAGDTTTETNETVSYWGNVRIVKTDAEGGAPLEGAEFELYTPGADGVCVKNDDQVAEQKVTVNGEDLWTTDAEGNATITGLHINAFANNGEAADPEQAPKYCLIEVKSPAGYELLSTPIELELQRTNVDNSETPVYELTSEVENIKSNIPQLPLTGGMGIGILAALGAALVGAGAWFARRNAQQA